MYLTPQQLLMQAKNELAHSAKTALLMAKLRIMHEEIFPAHGRGGVEFYETPEFMKEAA